MFQENGRLRLRAYASVQFIVAIFVICAPTAVLLGVIAGRASGSEGAAVLVDASLGGILLFSSLSAISIPWIYRPFSVLYSTYLAKRWIEASSQSSSKSAGFLPSTPQYLLSVGNLGVPTPRSLWKSLRYYFRRRAGISPVLSHSTVGLLFLISASALIIIGDIWLHAASSSVIAPSVLGTKALRNFSFAFAPPASPSQAPWRLQKGLQTYLNLNPNNTVINLNETMVIVPQNIPSEEAVLASTVGVQMSCNLFTPQCKINTALLTFDCSSIQPGATGTLGPVNATFYPSGIANSFKVLAAMGLPSLFNATSTVIAAQVFVCTGALQNITYLFSNGEFNLTNSTAIDFTPLTNVWNLTAFPGKSDIIASALDSVGKSTIQVEGMDVSTVPSIFSNGLSRIFTSFLSGEMQASPSLMVFPFPSELTKESPTSIRILSRIPLAPIIFNAIIIVSLLALLAYISWRALIAITEPPHLNGSPISIADLHRQLVSPIDVLAAALGDRPLSMNIRFDGQEEGRVHFDMTGDMARDGNGRDDDTLSHQSLLTDKASPPQPVGLPRMPRTAAFNDVAGYAESQQGQDELSEEEGRMIVGMRGRQDAQNYRQSAQLPPLSAGTQFSWGPISP